MGLFTAIRRLKTVYERLGPDLAKAGIPLYAQHVDPIDTGTLVDIFRDDPRASLLGTDALRDGVDVPGEALQTVIIPRLPFSVPDEPLLEARLEPAVQKCPEAETQTARRARTLPKFSAPRGHGTQRHFVHSQGCGAP